MPGDNLYRQLDDLCMRLAFLLVNLALYPQRDGKRVVAYRLKAMVDLCLQTEGQAFADAGNG